MADPSILEAVKVAGSAIIGGALVSFAKNFFTDSGKDAREFRQEYREEIKRLREQREKDQEEMEDMRDDIRAFRTSLEDQGREHVKQMDALHQQLRVMADLNLHLITTRAQARDALAFNQRAHNEPLTTWPDDPAAPPSGGTP